MLLFHFIFERHEKYIFDYYFHFDKHLLYVLITHRAEQMQVVVKAELQVRTRTPADLLAR